ncbi:hypothetical protein ACHAWX_002435 [Stephanocyclus meneghinianus]
MAMTTTRRRTRLFVVHTITVALGLHVVRQINWTANNAQFPPTFHMPSMIALDHPDAIARRRNTTLFPPPRDHPFAGARDANGHWGYVADPYMVRNHILLRFQRESGDAGATFDDMLKARYMPLEDHRDVNETDKVCETPPREGNEGDGWDVLVNKVVVGGPLPLPESPGDPREPPNGWRRGRPPASDAPPYFNTPNPPKIFCGMYTYHKKQYLLEAAVQSWAWRCDGFVAFSDVTDPRIGAVDLPHYGEESYGNMWQKVRSIWSYIHTHYFLDFDYFHLSGDDTLMIVDNLRNYLWSIDDENGTKPLYVGGAYKTQGVIVCGGGPGYTLNRVALHWLVNEAFAKPDHRADSGEDRLIGFTLRPLVHCYDTHDANGGQRYAGFDPTHYWHSCDKVRCSRNMVSQFKFWQDYVQKNVTGMDSISSQAVSFHLLRNQVMVKRVHAILYRTCPKGTVLGDALEKNHANSSSTVP